MKRLTSWMLSLLILFLLVPVSAQESSGQQDFYLGKKVFFRTDYKNVKNALVAEVCAVQTITEELVLPSKFTISSEEPVFSYSVSAPIAFSPDELQGRLCKEVIVGFSDNIKGGNPYNLQVILDPENIIVERNEGTNNSQKSTKNTIETVYFKGLPDLTPGGEIRFVAEYKGQKNVLRGEICNNQNGLAADTTIPFKFIISKQDQLLQKSGSKKITSSLGTNQCEEVAVSFGNDITKFGTNTVMLIIDTTNRIMEQSEYNNSTVQMGVEFVAFEGKKPTNKTTGGSQKITPPEDDIIYGYKAGAKKVSSHLKNYHPTNTKSPYELLRARAQQQEAEKRAKIQDEIAAIFAATEDHPSKEYIRKKYIDMLRKKYANQKE